MDIRSRPDDPEVERLARQIFAMFPKCMRCGQPIGEYEQADVRILTHRVVHKVQCHPDRSEEAVQHGADPSLHSG